MISFFETLKLILLLYQISKIISSVFINIVCSYHEFICKECRITINYQMFYYGVMCMNNLFPSVFICFSAKDRYLIAEPLVYHLKNYGINVWYDRYKLLLGDNRIKKNIIEGATNCQYAIIILSKNTHHSACATEEISILQSQYIKGTVTIFPILYELKPAQIPDEFQWLTDMIFKEVTKSSGTRELCNHISCRITEDILSLYRYNSIQSILHDHKLIPSDTYYILESYKELDTNNLNARISLLYSAYHTLIHLKEIPQSEEIDMVSAIFHRLFSETILNISVDYREIWLLENALCILINIIQMSRIESNI